MTAVTYWCEAAWLPDGVRHGVRLVIDGAYLADVQTAPEPAPADKVLPGLAMPGAANAHSHAFHRALRGAGAPGQTFWAWRETMYRIAANLTPERYERLARAVFAEMLAAGYTSVAEFHYVHHRPDGSPYEDPNAMGIALRDAARAVGIRLTVLDTCYLSSGFGAPPLPEQQRFSDGTAARWADRVTRLTALTDTGDTGTFRVGAAIHSVRAVDEDAARVVAGWAEDHGAPLHVHLSEQRAENDACLAATGLTPTALLARAGVWGPRSTAVHALHLTADDMRLLGDAGATVCICPSTEADLADGVAPAAALRAHGARLAVGSDQDVLADPFAEARAVEMNQRLVLGTRENLDPAALVDLLAASGQAAAGWPDAGRLQAGALADWIVLDTRATALAGVLPERAPVLAGADLVRDVYVGGRHVVRAGRCTFDPDPTAELDALCRELREGA